MRASKFNQQEIKYISGGSYTIMKHKFSKMGRVAIALVLALSLTLVMAVPVVAITEGATDATLITPTAYQQPSTSVTIRISGEADYTNDTTVGDDKITIVLPHGLPDAEEITAAADSLIDALVAVEENFIQLRVTGTGQDLLRWPAKLVGQLNYLASSTAIGYFRAPYPARAVRAGLPR